MSFSIDKDNSVYAVKNGSSKHIGYIRTKEIGYLTNGGIIGKLLNKQTARIYIYDPNKQKASFGYITSEKLKQLQALKSKGFEFKDAKGLPIQVGSGLASGGLPSADQKGNPARAIVGIAKQGGEIGEKNVVKYNGKKNDIIYQINNHDKLDVMKRQRKQGL